MGIQISLNTIPNIKHLFLCVKVPDFYRPHEGTLRAQLIQELDRLIGEGRLPEDKEEANQVAVTILADKKVPTEDKNRGWFIDMAIRLGARIKIAKQEAEMPKEPKTGQKAIPIFHDIREQAARVRALRESQG